MRIPLLIVLCILLLSTGGHAQDISGEWKGNFKYNVLNMIQPIQELIVKLEVYDDSLIEGTSFLSYNRGKFEYYKVRGIYNKEKGTVYFQEYEDIQVTPNFFTDYVKGNYTMKLTIEDGIMKMDGRWRENGNTAMGLMNSGVWLE